MNTLPSPKAAFTLVEIMIVVAIIGLLAAIGIPSFVRARTTAQTKSCINNLRQIDGAKQQWALERNVGPTASPVVSDIQPYVGRGSSGALPTCPSDPGQQFSTSYSINDMQNAPTCLILPTGTPAHALN